MGRAVQQDFEHRTENFFFTAPIRKGEYLAGRFLGAIAVLIVVMSSNAFGSAVGLFLPGIDPDRVGPFRLAVDPAPVSAWRLLPRMIWLNFRETVKNIYFGVIALAGILFYITTSTTTASLFGTNTWPVTYQMLELVSGTFSVFMLVIVTFYAGELA